MCWPVGVRKRYHHTSSLCVNIVMTVTLHERHLESLTTSLFIQQFVRANIKENIKAPYYWLFGMKRQVDSHIKGQ